MLEVVGELSIVEVPELSLELDDATGALELGGAGAEELEPELLDPDDEELEPELLEDPDDEVDDEPDDVEPEPFEAARGSVYC